MFMKERLTVQQHMKINDKNIEYWLAPPVSFKATSWSQPPCASRGLHRIFLSVLTLLKFLLLLVWSQKTKTFIISHTFSFSPFQTRLVSKEKKKHEELCFARWITFVWICARVNNSCSDYKDVPDGKLSAKKKKGDKQKTNMAGISARKYNPLNYPE